MSHIKLKNNNQGIVSLFEDFPKVAEPMSILAETLLRGESPLPQWFREYIASSVSRDNSTEFCGRSHMAAAVASFGAQDKQQLHNLVSEDLKLRALSVLAKKVTGNEFTGSLIDTLLEEKIATEREVHDIVAIAAAFSMYNRYVCGLGVDKPTISTATYQKIGERLAHDGYLSNVKQEVPENL